MDFLSGSKSPSPTRAGATREMDKTSSCCQVMLLPTQNGVAGMTSLPFLVNRPPTITTSSNKTKPIALRSSNLDRFSAQPPSCYVVSSEDPASHLSSETFRNSSLSLRPQAILSTFTSNSLTSRRREASDVIFPQPLEGQASTSSAGDWSSVGPNHSGARHSLLLPIAACSLSPTLTSLSVGNTCQSAAATPTVGDHLLVRNRSSSRPILSSILNSGAPTFAPLTSEVSTTFLAKSAGAFAITTSHGNSNTNLVSSRSSSSTFANPAFVNPILTQTPYSHHFSPRPGAFQTVAASHIVRSLQASEHSESTSNRPFKVNVPGGESIAGMCNLPAPYGVGACRLAFGPSAVHHHYPHQTALVHFAPGVLNPQTKLFTPAGYATSAAACWSSMSCPSASLSSLGSTGPGVGSSSVIGAGNGAGFCALRRISGTPDRASAIAAWPRKPGVEIGSRLNQSDSIPSPEAGGKMLGSRDFVDASTSMDDSGIVRSDPRSFLPEGRDNLKSAQIGLVLLHSQSALGPLNDTRNQAEGQEEKAEGGSEVGIGEVHGKESFEACTHHPQQNNSTDTLSPSSDKEDTLLGTDSKAHPTFLQPTEIYASDTLTPLTRQMPTGQQIGSSRDLRVGLSPSSDNFSFALPASVADTEPKMSVGGTRLQNSFSCTDDPCFVTTFNRSVSSSLDPHLCQTHRSDKSADRLNHLPCRTGLLNPC
ncbi:unnamed protein product [Protopolystoma xenopodis]|uniref:Uncharacterized protein n=1 Tax=Protopolystoma xenopodis TaxID=117903 RepID=A0A448WF65_9PLAT|nr:unnamed protein product [Protopolystoma xenopodis]